MRTAIKDSSPRHRFRCEPLEQRRLLSAASLIAGFGAYSAQDDHLVIGNRAYFRSANASGYFRVGVTDGTIAGTQQVGTELGNVVSSAASAKFTELGGRPYFLAPDAFTGDLEIFSLDPVTLALVRHSSSSGTHSTQIGVTSMVVFGSTIYYIGSTSNGMGLGLFRLIGPNSNSLVFSKGTAGIGAEVTSIASIDGLLYLGVRRADGLAAVYKSDGTTAGTSEIRSFPAIGYTVEPTGFAKTSNGVIFTYGSQVWVTDGTSAGTIQIATTNNASGNYPSRVVSTGEFAVFGSFLSTALYRTDGTAAGTVLTGTSLPDFYSRALVLAGQSVYVPGEDGLHRITADAVTPVYSSAATGFSASASDTTDFAYEVEGRVFFTANFPGMIGALGRTDGTVVGTELIDDIDPSPNVNLNLVARSMFGVNGLLVFTGTNGLYSLPLDAPALPSIAGYAFKDINQDGIRQSSELNESRRSFFLDLDGDGFPNTSLEVTVPTIADGSRLLRWTPPGEYTVREVATTSNAYLLRTTPASGAVNVSSIAGQSIAPVLFGYYPRNVVSGNVRNDLNANSTVDSGEPGLAGVTVLFDLNHNRLIDSGEPTTTTDPSGNWTISDVPLGIYEILPIAPPGFEPTIPFARYPYSTNADGSALAQVQLAVSQATLPTKVTGVVFDDANRNGQFDQSETLLTPRVFNDLNDNGVFDGSDVSAGYYSTTKSYQLYNDLTGTYRLRIDLQFWPGWVPTRTPQTFTMAPGEQVFNVDIGIAVALPQGNAIGGAVFDDANLNGIREQGELSLATSVGLDLDNNGFISTDEPRRVLDSLGRYQFNDLPAGEYDVRLRLTNFNYTPTLPANFLPAHVVLLEGQQVGNVTLAAGLVPTASLIPYSLYTFLDANRDGIRQTTEGPKPTFVTMLPFSSSTGTTATAASSTPTFKVPPNTFERLFRLPIGWEFGDATAVDRVVTITSALPTQLVGLYRPRATVSTAGYDMDTRKIVFNLSTECEISTTSTDVTLRDSNGSLISSSWSWTPGDTFSIGSGTQITLNTVVAGRPVLADGVYTVTIAGRLLAATDDAVAPPNYTFTFSVLNGDLDLNGSIGFSDLLVLSQSYGTTGRTYSQGNVNYSANGSVDFDDLLFIAQKLGQSSPIHSTNRSAPRGRTASDILA